MLEETAVDLKTHPEPEVLAAFSRGALPPEELAAVADHVAGCESCCLAVAAVPDDTLGGLARQAGNTPTDTTVIPHFVIPDNGIPAIPTALVNHPRYRILDHLGAGGMGVVYKAEHRMMGRIVALKVLAPHLTAKPDAVERFRREVTAAAKLNHGNIVTAHDADEAGGMHFLVMEFVEGISLDKLVRRRGPLAVPMACQFARQVALGLQHAFEKGMVHRDIKPQNLMVTRKGQVKVLDFGLARFARDQEVNPDGAYRPAAVTAASLLMGTPEYLSPEQARDSRAVDIRSDIYSLGGTLYFLLTGSVPFPHATTLIDKLLAHTEEEPTPVRTHRPEVPEELAAVVAKLMAKKPADRFQTPSEVAAALVPFARAGAAVEVVPMAEVVAEPTQPIASAATVPVGGPANEFAFGSQADVAIPDGPTLVEKSRPRPKRKAPPARNRKWLAIAGVALFGLLAGVIIRQAVKKPADSTTGAPETKAPANTGGKGTALAGPGKTPDPPNGPVDAAAKPKILFVLQSSGVWMPDYKPVRERLEKNGATVVTGSIAPRFARTAWSKDTPIETIPIDVNLSPSMDVTEYAAVVFCGKDYQEFIGFGSGAQSVRALLEKMKSVNKPVGAICTGQGVLISHGWLRDKPAALNPLLQEKHPFAGVKWEAKPVVVIGKVVTGADSDSAVEFADTLLRMIRGE